MRTEGDVEIEGLRMCHVSGSGDWVGNRAWKSNEKGKRAESQDPHGGLQAISISKETDQERKKFCDWRSDRAERHDTGALSRQA